MKLSELRERTDAGLTELIGEMERDLWKARFNNHTNQLDDTAKIRRLKRDVARAKTILNERSRQRSSGQG